MTDKTLVGSGIPFSVKIKTYLTHTIIALIMLIVYVIIFQFLAGNATHACAELKRVSDAPHSEIVYTGTRYGGDSFYYLNRQHVVGMANTGVSCDILMTEDGKEYSDNDVYFKGTLKAGTCAVSQNLADAYGLRIGDTARIAGTEISFEVERYVTAQSGLDKEYLHDGIIILSYDEELLNKPYSYVSFDTDGDEYHSLLNLVFIEDWVKDNVNTLVVCAVVAIAVFAASAVVCEFFLFRARRRDYRLLVALGKPQGRLYLSVWLENVLKYILPALVVAAIYSAKYYCYGALYVLPALFPACIGLLSITVYSLIIIRRLYKCRAKTKRS